jgi:hypothetical protein
VINAPGAATLDRITEVKISSVALPLPTGISDAKVLTGRQQPMTLSEHARAWTEAENTIRA